MLQNFNCAFQIGYHVRSYRKILIIFYNFTPYKTYVIIIEQSVNTNIVCMKINSFAYYLFRSGHLYKPNLCFTRKKVEYQKTSNYKLIYANEINNKYF